MEPKDWIPLAGQILVFAGFAFAVVRFEKEKIREFQKRFFEEQLKIFSEAVDHASSTTLHERNLPAFKIAADNFRRLYWGKMCIVEDKKVEAKMIEFNIALHNYEHATSREEQEKLKIELQHKSLSLAHTCRNSSLNTWKIKYRLDDFNDYSLNEFEKMKKSPQG